MKEPAHKRFPNQRAPTNDEASTCILSWPAGSEMSDVGVRVRPVLPKYIAAINFQKIAAATVDSNWRIQGIDLLAMVGG